MIQNDDTAYVRPSLELSAIAVMQQNGVVGILVSTTDEVLDDVDVRRQPEIALCADYDQRWPCRRYWKLVCGVPDTLLDVCVDFILVKPKCSRCLHLEIDNDTSGRRELEIDVGRNSTTPLFRNVGFQRAKRPACSDEIVRRHRLGKLLRDVAMNGITSRPLPKCRLLRNDIALYMVDVTETPATL